ncbi:MAG: response regulator [Oleiphilaceae bacterium]|nr:response regulator [Oleiphilaceae bacterium]
MAPIKVLVVDDASFVRDLVKRTLRNHFPGIEMQEASNGRKAQALLHRQMFDLILCDWEMPEMSGLELLRWVRQQDAYRKKPFIMITSRGDRDHVVEAVREGVTDYLGKPFSAEGLVNKVIKVMGDKLGRQAAVPSASRSSADLLTGGAAPRKAPDTQKTSDGLRAPDPLRAANPLKAADPQKAPDPLKASSAEKSAGKVPVPQSQLRFSGGTLQCVIRSITLTEVQLRVRYQDPMPGILAQAVVDVPLGEDRMARLNGYVSQLQAVDQRQDSDFIQLVVRWVDEDPQKLADLTHYIARFRRA